MECTPTLGPVSVMFEAQLGFYKKNILEWHSRDSFFVTSAGLNIPLTNHD